MKKGISGVFLGLVAVLVGVLIHQALRDNKTVSTVNNTTTVEAFADSKALSELADSIYNTEEKTTEYEPHFEYTKGKILGGGDYYIDNYYNMWLNMEIDIPENYTEIEQDVYEQIESETGDDCGMYYVDENSNSITIGFADLTGYEGITAEYYLKTALEESLSTLSEYGYSFSGLISDCYIAGKNFKKAYVVSDILGTTVSMYTYQKDGKMCYITITGNSAEDNDELVSRFNAIY